MVACDALPLQFRLTYCIVTNDWTNLEEVVIKVAVHKGNTHRQYRRLLTEKDIDVVAQESRTNESVLSFRPTTKD
jgi:hypothetical protein